MDKADFLSGIDLYLKGERPPRLETDSGIPVPLICGPADVEGLDYTRDLGDAGCHPFTRGIHRDMYRGRFWTRRQILGYGGPAETNRRIKFLFKEGQTGLNLVPDLVGAHGFDPDDPAAEGEVGVQGVSISTLREMAETLRDLPLDRMSVTLIAKPPCGMIWLAMLVALAEKRGLPPACLRGTVMNDPLFQISGGVPLSTHTRFFPLGPAMRLAVDTLEYCSRHLPRINTPCVNGYNVRETGVNAIQEIAFTLAGAVTFVEGGLARGLPVDAFVPRLSFFLASHMDFFEEVAKFRAFRRIWARLVRERYGAQEERSLWFRFSAQTSGIALTAQQPLNNVVRTTLQVLAAVLGGAQAVQASAFDEALSLPTEDSHRLVVRTSQIIGYETGVTRTADPLGGAYCVEWLTNRLEAEGLALFEKIQAMGGMVAAIESGWMEGLVNEARSRRQADLETGRQILVGVNAFRSEEEPRVKIHRTAARWERERRCFIRQLKRARNQRRAARALDGVREAMARGENVFPPVIAAVKASATLGEISHAMREAIGFGAG
ncbi:MAG: methylmalonyl-CoA mutase [Candidatus Rokubacteria bacterium]|nr:methylmalonyl-CoA mutase [Candidatus Rokubacteria bacterium]